MEGRAHTFVPKLIQGMLNTPFIRDEIVLEGGGWLGPSERLAQLFLPPSLCSTARGLAAACLAGAGFRRAPRHISDGIGFSPRRLAISGYGLGSAVAAGPATRRPAHVTKSLSPPGFDEPYASAPRCHHDAGLGPGRPRCLSTALRSVRGPQWARPSPPHALTGLTADRQQRPRPKGAEQKTR